MIICCYWGGRNNYATTLGLYATDQEKDNFRDLIKFAEYWNTTLWGMNMKTRKWVPLIIRDNKVFPKH